jgi:ABC-2 type transport system permease protein
MNKLWVIIRKEWGEVFKNRLVLFTVGFLPIIMTALPLITLYASGSTEEMVGMSAADLPARFGDLCAGLSAASCGQYFIVSQFMLLFMLMPLAIPVTIASYSIVGEKTTRTLEPVLATPIKTWELLVGKGLAAGIPAVMATWASFLIFILGATFLSAGPDLILKLVDPLWLVAVFIVGPLLSIAAVSAAVMVSSRANDPRVAEQLSMLVVIPLLGLFFAQIAGLIYINRDVILWLALGLAFLDAVLVYFTTQIFQREAILTRWQ